MGQTVPPTAVANPERLRALRQTAMLDSPVEAAFDRLTRLVTQVLYVPVSLVSLVDLNRQFFKSSIGLPEPWASRRETPLSHSFCQHVIQTGEALLIEDARLDARLRDNAAIQDLGVIAYAGLPLRASEGYVLGTLCAIDNQPHRWLPRDIEILAALAESVMTEIDLRMMVREVAAQRTILARENAKVALLLDATMEGIIGLDRRGTCTFINRAAASLLGLPPERQTGWCIWDVLSGRHETASDGMHPLVMETLAKGKVTIQSEVVFHRHDGNVLPVSFHAVPLRRDGQVLGAVVTFLDATLARQLQVARHRIGHLEETVRQRDEFIAVASHELKRPLNTLKLRIDVMRMRLSQNRPDALDPETVGADLQQLSEYCGHLNKMIVEIMDASRLTLVGLQLTPEPVDVVELVQDVVARMALVAQHAGSALSVVSQAGASVVGCWDRQRLEQVVSNLLDNAIKFGDGQPIEMRLQAAGRQVRLTVQDHGPGIAPEDQERIFQRFFRQGGRTSGAGLGLWIVRRIVEAQGGTVTVASTPGHGAAFTVALPRQFDQVCPPAAA
jgi:PAS domain S-box-containing protein